MSRLIVNPTRHIQHCCAESGEWVGSDKLLTLRPIPTQEDVDNYLSGLSEIPNTTGSWSPIAGLCAIPPRTSWRISRKRYDFVNDLQSFRAQTATLGSTLHYARSLVARGHYGNLLGVELSGGLDTSIIIELLIRWEIPFALIGMKNERYEFRTEHEVQIHYAKHCPTVRFYSDRDIPAFSRLDEVPPHPFPTMASLNFAHAQKKAELCRDVGVTTLLSGDAGDRLLGFHSPQWSPSGRTPENWAYWNLAQTLWTDQYIFQPIGIRFVSGLAVGRIPTLILRLRSGLGEDRMKIWSRRQLKSYLPSILTDYAYKAFHDGWVNDGIIAANHTIRKMAELAYDIVPHPELAPNRMEETIMDFRRLTAEKQNQLLLRLSFVTWVYSNHR